MSNHFRSIKPEDFPTCARLLSKAYSGEPWYNTWSHDDALLRIEAIMSGFSARGYVMEYNQKIVAMCLGRIDYYYNNWRQFCIDEFNVLPDYQGKQIGSKMLTYVTDAMKQQDINRMFLITGGAQAARFYQHNGFEVSTEGTMMEFVLNDLFLSLDK